MVAVRSIAANWGLGPRFERKMSMRDTLDYHLLSKIGYKDLADGIVSGRIRTTNADLPPKVELPDPVKREEESFTMTCCSLICYFLSWTFHFSYPILHVS